MIWCSPSLTKQTGHKEPGTAASSAIAKHQQVAEAMGLLEERFRDIGRDGPSAYSSFLAAEADVDGQARLSQEAVQTVREFIQRFGTTS
jgi:hypothetical protein